MKRLMIRKFKNIISILLLLAFLLPTVVKLEHQHKQLSYILKNEKRQTVIKENCPICSFEFSVFISFFGDSYLQNEYHLEGYCITYNSQFNFNSSKYSFLLRAPPYQQI